MRTEPFTFQLACSAPDFVELGIPTSRLSKSYTISAFLSVKRSYNPIARSGHVRVSVAISVSPCEVLIYWKTACYGGCRRNLLAGGENQRLCKYFFARPFRLAPYGHGAISVPFGSCERCWRQPRKNTDKDRTAEWRGLA